MSWVPGGSALIHSAGMSRSAVAPVTPHTIHHQIDPPAGLTVQQALILINLIHYAERLLKALEKAITITVQQARSRNANADIISTFHLVAVMEGHKYVRGLREHLLQVSKTSLYGHLKKLNYNPENNRWNRFSEISTGLSVHYPENIQADIAYFIQLFAICKQIRDEIKGETKYTHIGLLVKLQDIEASSVKEWVAAHRQLIINEYVQEFAATKGTATSFINGVIENIMHGKHLTPSELSQLQAVIKKQYDEINKKK